MTENNAGPAIPDRRCSVCRVVFIPLYPHGTSGSGVKKSCVSRDADRWGACYRVLPLCRTVLYWSGRKSSETSVRGRWRIRSGSPSSSKTSRCTRPVQSRWPQVSRDSSRHLAAHDLCQHLPLAHGFVLTQDRSIESPGSLCQHLPLAHMFVLTQTLGEPVVGGRDRDDVGPVGPRGLSVEEFDRRGVGAARFKADR